MNTNNKLKKYLNKLYYKCNQRIYLHSEYEEQNSVKNGIYFSQEIYVSEYSEEMFKKDLKNEAKRLGVSFEELWLTHEDNKHEFISYYDKYLFTIRTLDDLMISNSLDLGHTPYYQIKDWERLFTVQRFGQLTDDDIFYAIEYFINKILDCWVFNIYYNGKRVHTSLEKMYPDYRKDNSELKAKKYWNEKKYYGVFI